eukprot:gnl/Hemi2/7408_TR2533_c0_g1_i1.p2 gnl/Hemi2/7408_TR2533_c0_g1~~gnl/Hemi2/7408_TR2533_c0_g1_i1.p2  ORF type:complete len:370 (-),score=117.71 gnl/Hemi2/7408_TR2533_c0_g1_i1:115-1224(-)
MNSSIEKLTLKGVEKVRSQLQAFGYHNVPDDVLMDFIRQAAKEKPAKLANLDREISQPLAESPRPFAGRGERQARSNNNGVRPSLATNASSLLGSISTASSIVSDTSRVLQPQRNTPSVMSNYSDADENMPPMYSFTNHANITANRLPSGGGGEVEEEEERGGACKKGKKAAAAPSPAQLLARKPALAVKAPAARATVTATREKRLSSCSDPAPSAATTKAALPKRPASATGFRAPSVASTTYRSASPPVPRPKVLVTRPSTAPAPRLPAPSEGCWTDCAPHSADPYGFARRPGLSVTARRPLSPNIARKPKPGTAARKTDRVNNYQWYAQQWKKTPILHNAKRKPVPLPCLLAQESFDDGYSTPLSLY